MNVENEKGYLGLFQQTCRICDASGEFKTYLGREMMQGSREEFRYFVCSCCECLQIEVVPKDLYQYYGKNYYSYSEPDIKECPNEVSPKSDYILDIGCGAGDWLCDIAQEGYKNLFGCDPFILNDLEYQNGVKIKKATIHEMQGKFDVIRLADSFEHMADPLDVFLKIKELLKSKGYCWLSIPVYPNIAFDLFGTDWYQMDPPRHLFLHSKKSIQYLANKSGLRVEKIRFDSNNNQFIRSKMYQFNIPFYEQTPEKCMEYISQIEGAKYNLDAEESNKNEVGDHAIFYLTHDEYQDNTDKQQALELSNTVIEALEYLIKQSEIGKLEQNSYMLKDILQAHKVMREKFLR